MHRKHPERWLVGRTRSVTGPGSGGGCPVVRHHAPLPFPVMCTWEPKEGLRSNQGTKNHHSPSYPCISQMPGPLASLANPAAQEPTASPGVLHILLCPSSSQNPGLLFQLPPALRARSS